MKILFVCTGNICRSSMADALFRKLLKKKQLDSEIMCQNAGLSDLSAKEISHNVGIALKDYNIDVSDFKPRKFKKDEISVWDVFFTMGDTHTYILEKAGIPSEKIYTPSKNIPDPYGGDEETYKNCAKTIKNELEYFLDRLCNVYEFKNNGASAYKEDSTA